LNVIIVYVILFTTSLACLFWLASRISHESTVGAYLTFLVLPGFYWTYKYWNSQRAALRVPAMAAFGAVTLTVGVILLNIHLNKAQIAEQADATKANPMMMKWCREQNDGVYDPVLKVCVEPTKADVLADEAKENSMAQFEQYLNQHGLGGTLDRADNAAIKALKDSPDVADAGSFKLAEQTAGQPPLMIALCLSQSACTHLASRQIKDTGNIGVGKGRLMLLLPPDAMDQARLKSLKKVVDAFQLKAP
jgi:hypothetical protein